MKFVLDSKKRRNFTIIFFVVFIVFVLLTISGARSQEPETTAIIEVEERIEIAEPTSEPVEPYIPVYTEYKSEESEEYLWYKLSEFSPSDHITAGVLGYFKRESELKSDAVAGWPTTLQVMGEDHCVIFTEAVDAGLPDGSSKERFVYECKFKYGGYGLGQWSSEDYCEDLYALARKRGKSIGDADLQCEFVFLSMRKNEYLWEQLMSCESPQRAGELIALLYDGSVNAMGYTSTMATHYHNKYAKGLY